MVFSQGPKISTHTHSSWLWRAVKGLPEVHMIDPISLRKKAFKHNSGKLTLFISKKMFGGRISRCDCSSFVNQDDSLGHTLEHLLIGRRGQQVGIPGAGIS